MIECGSRLLACRALQEEDSITCSRDSFRNARTNSLALYPKLLAAHSLEKTNTDSAWRRFASASSLSISLSLSRLLCLLSAWRTHRQLPEDLGGSIWKPEVRIARWVACLCSLNACCFLSLFTRLCAIIVLCKAFAHLSLSVSLGDFRDLSLKFATGENCRYPPLTYNTKYWALLLYYFINIIVQLL